MIKFELEVKEAIVQQAINRGNKSIREIAKLNNVGYSTLERWMHCYKKGDLTFGSKTNQGSSKCPSEAEKFEHIVATHNLEESALGAYCRTHGLYSHVLSDWREELLLMTTRKEDSKLRTELRQLKVKNKDLARELRRKEKALAEASALLVLKKKANLIWGVNEDD